MRSRVRVVPPQVVVRSDKIRTCSFIMHHSGTERLVQGPPDDVHIILMAGLCWSILKGLFHLVGQSVTSL